MKVILIDDSKLPVHSPDPGSTGEALYFRYAEDGQLRLHVLFYGWPGVWSVDPHDVDSLLS